MQSIIIIAAVAKNNVIGRNNQLIWRLPADLKRFKQLTLGHAMIMGRKTFDSIGRPLPGRSSVIVTRDRNYTQENCIIAYSLEEAFLFLKDQKEIFVIGGADIYQQSLAFASKMYITHIDEEFDGDVFFPEFSLEEWTEEERLTFDPDEKNAMSYSFTTYVRK